MSASHHLPWPTLIPLQALIVNAISHLEMCTLTPFTGEHYTLMVQVWLHNTPSLVNSQCNMAHHNQGLIKIVYSTLTWLSISNHSLHHLPLTDQYLWRIPVLYPHWVMHYVLYHDQIETNHHCNYHPSKRTAHRLPIMVMASQRTLATWTVHYRPRFLSLQYLLRCQMELIRPQTDCTLKEHKNLRTRTTITANIQWLLTLKF